MIYLNRYDSFDEWWLNYAYDVWCLVVMNGTYMIPHLVRAQKHKHILVSLRSVIMILQKQVLQHKKNDSWSEQKGRHLRSLGSRFDLHKHLSPIDSCKENRPWCCLSQLYWSKRNEKDSRVVMALLVWPDLVYEGIIWQDAHSVEAGQTIKRTQWIWQTYYNATKACAISGTPYSL